MEIMWEKIIGHIEIIQRLKRLINENRMPHALLFVGPKGIGKFLTAQITAAALFCNGKEKPCGLCPSCQALLTDTHPDFYTVEPDGKMIKIEQIRHLQTEVALAPYLADKRVVIIDQAETMNVQAANSLLKILEEPTGNLIFILIANNRQALLDTIISRCMMVTFQTLELSCLSGALEQRGIAADDAAALAALAEGSLGKAIDLQDNGGLELRRQAFDMLLQIQQMDMDAVWGCGQKLGELDRQKLQEFVLYLNMLLRDFLVLQVDEQSNKLYNQDVAPVLLEQKIYWSENKLLRAMKEITVVQKMLGSNANARLVMEQFLIKLRDL